MGFVVEKAALEQVSLRVLPFPLSASFNPCSIFTHASPEGGLGVVNDPVPRRQCHPIATITVLEAFTVTESNKSSPAIMSSNSGKNIFVSM
jgi:hypothetical protein